jgi:hypothetical protein
VASKVPPKGTAGESSVTVSVDDGSVTRRWENARSPTATSLDEWWALLSPATDGPFTVRPWAARASHSPTLRGARERPSRDRGELPFLRAEAEARMVDTFDIKVESGKPAYDPVTKTTGPGLHAAVHDQGPREGRRRARGTQRRGRRPHLGNGDPRAPHPGRLTGGPRRAVAFCTAVDETSDPTLLGAQLRLSGPAPGSQTTARRLEVSEVLT